MSEKDSHDLSITRRDQIRLTALGTAGAVGLAGCMGQDDGGDGGDGGSGGDGGDGGGETEELTFAVSPALTGGTFVLDKWYEETGTFEYPFHDDGAQARWREAGYTIDWVKSWDEATLFASRQSQLGHMGPIDAAQLAVNRDQNITFFGAALTSLHGWGVQKGGPYDPAETGSVQASLDQIVEDGATVAHVGWESGSLRFQQIVVNERYGYNITQENNDFNVQTTEYGTIPQLLEQGDIAAGVMLPASGAGYEQLVEDETITMLWWDRNVFEEEGWGLPILQNPAVHTDFYESNPDAVRMCLEDWNKGQEIMVQNNEDIAADEANWETIGADNEAEAQFIMDLYVTSDADEIDPKIDYPVVTYPVPLDDDRIEGIKNTIRMAEDLGTVAPGWEDRLNWVTGDEVLTGDITPEPL